MRQGNVGYHYVILNAHSGVSKIRLYEILLHIKLQVYLLFRIITYS